MTQKFQAVMFDLDGTLADTLEDIAAAGNHAMTAVGRPTHPVASYRYLAGQGLASLVRHALGPEHQDLAPAATAAFIDYYGAHDMDRTRLFDGMADLLDALVARKLTLAVLSNKPHPAAVEVVRRLMPAWSFAVVAGAKAEVPLKPDPAGAIAIVEETGIPAERWMYLGDTDVDMRTARSAGMFAVGVLWGFREEAELRGAGAQAIVSHPRDIEALL